MGIVTILIIGSVFCVLMSVSRFFDSKADKLELDNNQFIDIKSKLEEINTRLDNVEKNIKEK
jgi:hypothetical protein